MKSIIIYYIFDCWLSTILKWHSKYCCCKFCHIEFQLFSLVILGCVANAQSINDGSCPISPVDPSTCNYEIGLSIVAILTILAFLYSDVYIGRLKDLTLEKKFVAIDIIISFIYILLWFIGFWYLFNRWSESDRTHLKGIIIDNVKCGLAFSFISILSWVSPK